MEVGWTETQESPVAARGRDGQREKTGPIQTEPGSTELCALRLCADVWSRVTGSPGAPDGASERNYNLHLPLLSPEIQCALSTGPSNWMSEGMEV